MNPISILITNRNTKDFLALCVDSVRQNQATQHELIIMDDNSTDGSKEWLEQNKTKYDYIYYTHSDKERHGIVGMVDEAVAKATHDIIYILHSDMVCGKGYDTNLVKNLKSKTIVSSTRIEPPLHPPEPCKITEPLGNFPEEFQKGKFAVIVEEIKNQKLNNITEGVFAPTLCYKKDWLGHDKLFYPQSREDSDWQYSMKQKGYKFIQAWDSIVYHFTSRGSRFNNETKETLKDSDEWKQTNKKNTKNFIRKWGTTPLYTPTKNPVVIEKVPISAHVLACDRDVDYVYPFLEMVEPYFDEIVFVIDYDPVQINLNKTETRLKTKVEEEIERYCNTILSNAPTNFTSDKIKVLHRNLVQSGVRDFGAQTNFAISKCKNNWVMKIDLDEMFNEQFLNSLGQFVHEAENAGKNTIGLPRLNFLNEVLVNDIPRDQWTPERLMHYPKYKPGQRLDIKNPDYQFRLHTKDIKWVGKVHEVPETVARQENTVTLINSPFTHPKTITRQNSQDQMYNKIAEKKPVKKIVYDSVIFTTEGITKHAREEIKQWEQQDYHVQIMDTYRHNPKIEDCEYFKKFYNPIDVVNDDYVTICNQPPERWNKTLGYKNFIGYLAFEGYLPMEWVKVMNSSQVKEVWTPSNYCKQAFMKSGVQKPITVIPHGINPDVWKPLGYQWKQDEPFTYLWMGTTHNTRKGMDIAIKAFSQAFKPEDNVRLVLKTNKIYNTTVDANKIIKKNLAPGGNSNIYVIDDELTEQEMVELVNLSQVYVSPHRSEGFGINILQALATGIPVIATRATGNMDFCNENNTHFIEVEKMKRWAPFVYPYVNSMWDEPIVESLVEQLKAVRDTYEDCRAKSIKEARKIREEWTWRAVVNKMVKRVNQLV